MGKAGRIFVASMNMRGKWAKTPADVVEFVKLNVTSAQSKTSKTRRDFSPMTHRPGGYKGFWCFENYWQSGKVLEGVDHEKTTKWWKGLKEPKRRYPGSRGMKVLHAKFAHIEQPLGWVESRTQVYVPEYHALMKETESAKEWKAKATKEKSEEETGQGIVVYDFDGPRDGETNEPLCCEVTKELLREKAAGTKHPFGHGYIVAGFLAGFEPRDYMPQATVADKQKKAAK